MGRNLVQNLQFYKKNMFTYKTVGKNIKCLEK